MLGFCCQIGMIMGIGYVGYSIMRIINKKFMANIIVYATWIGCLNMVMEYLIK